MKFEETQPGKVLAMLKSLNYRIGPEELAGLLNQQYGVDTWNTTKVSTVIGRLRSSGWRANIDVKHPNSKNVSYKWVLYFPVSDAEPKSALVDSPVKLCEPASDVIEETTYEEAVAKEGNTGVVEEKTPDARPMTELQVISEDQVEKCLYFIKAKAPKGVNAKDIAEFFDTTEARGNLLLEKILLNHRSVITTKVLVFAA